MMDFTHMDPRTAKVAIQLQLGDIAELLDSFSTSNDAAVDAERASLKTIHGELSQQLTVLEGQILVVKILKDEYHERVAFKKLLDEFNKADGGIDDTQWEMAKELYASAFDGDGIHSALEEEATVADRAPLHGIRTTAATKLKKTAQDSNTFIMCNACLEVVYTKDTLQLQCEHTYCRTCLLDLFTSSISNPTLFPPRCCKVSVPLDTCRVMLPKQLIKEFDLKVEELATSNPTYCANADCHSFIQPKDIVAEVGSCVFCQEKTCVQCKNQSHDGLCPSDPHVQLLMDIAKRSKWQQSVGANTNSATCAVCSGSAALALSGTKTISLAQHLMHQYILPLLFQKRQLSLTSMTGIDILGALARYAVQIIFLGSCAAAAATIPAAGAAFTTATETTFKELDENVLTSSVMWCPTLRHIVGG
ncbi:hypothetical protein OPT61_g1279 [Boeremia exigua]|uniref:Uncharacterized protein n=1 Tax=Boeremia exigua TaxID=749465 RepID=A0ACC2IQM4_9PLEO|nr:hypothetical protein OPT61_g1279 [Boeremia exigua]